MRIGNVVPSAIWIVLLLACPIWLRASASAASDDAKDGPTFGFWSAPANVGEPVNSVFVDQGAFISKEGLSLYFHSDRPGGFGGTDIYVSQRTTVDAPWGPPQNLGPNINTPFNESTARLSIDGHRLYFTSDRPGGFGGNDIYVSRRHNKRDDSGWQPADNLGAGVNTPFSDQNPSVFEDDATGIITLYFSSNRPGGLGGDDIYASELQPDETFGLAALVTELSSPFTDRQPAIRRDGLEMFLASDRPGTFGMLDLWVSSRASTSDHWSDPLNLGSVVNSSFIDAAPAISFDGRALYFQSAHRSDAVGGQGVFDIYVTTRRLRRAAGAG